MVKESTLHPKAQRSSVNGRKVKELDGLVEEKANND
jgi:hypothetical protein